jgi:hypothetical protein
MRSQFSALFADKCELTRVGDRPGRAGLGGGVAFAVVDNCCG